MPPMKKTARKKLQVTISAAPRLWKSLRALATAYNAAESRAALSVPYVITCAATLEAMLNDALTGYVWQTW